MKNMTICIAALCENNKKIILAADRMITVGNFIEFEHDVKKFEQITKNCYIMTAGTTTIQNDVIQKLKSQIKNINAPEFKQIIEELKNSYSSVRLNRSEELFLRPKGLDFGTFYQNQRGLLPEFVFEITRQINENNLGVEYILCGFDDDDGHIQYIIDPGVSESFDSVGFCATGTGNINAISVFTIHNYSPSFPLYKALYLVFLAKKDAERAPGVGCDTDIAYLTKEDGIKHLKPNEITELQRIYDEYSKVEDKEYKDVKDNIVDKW
jgi:20S proteasome alpha/beta subunit